MKVEIENTFFVWNKEITEMYVALVNVLVSALNEQQLRESMKGLFTVKGFDEYFKYGFGHHHLWVAEITPCGGAVNKETRFLIVRF